MTKILAIITAAFISLLLAGVEFGRGRIEPKKIVGEGVIVAFQVKNRYPVNPFPKGIGTPVEFWIVRIDQWIECAKGDDKYVLVQYKLYKRGLSDDEIHSNRLRFTLRERRDDEHTDCLGEVIMSREPKFETRPVALSDYQRTEPGKLDEIPLLPSLPCLIADAPPVVIVDK